MIEHRIDSMHRGGCPERRPRRGLLSAGLLGLLLSLVSVSGQAACQLTNETTVEQLVLPLREEIRHDHRHYFAQLLQLALDKTAAEQGPCEVVLSAHATAQARLYQQLSLQDGVHIIDATAMPERDERFDTSGLAVESGLALAYPWPEDLCARYSLDAATFR